MKNVLVTGASGLVGRALCSALTEKGYRVRTLSRSTESDFQWDIRAGAFDSAALEEVDAVVHLAGESVAQRWTEAAKRRIRDSRVDGTELLVREIVKSGSNPVFIAASGINYYGYSLAQPVDDSAPLGTGFLAEVCRDWEGAAHPLEEAGLRCCYVRTGVVLSAEGGALAKMLPPFRLGLGGPVGSGRQWMSWIALEDIVRVFVAAISDERYRGPINAVTDSPVENRVFTKQLSEALGRPAVFPLPSFAVNLAFGEMARETILSNLRVKPKRLLDLEFKWELPTIDFALNQILDT